MKKLHYYNITIGEVEKLVLTLNDKKKCVLHYRNLQLYHDLGVKLKKIQWVLQFSQSVWLKQYINFNTNKRTNAENLFEKDFFKLMTNSIFGRTMEYTWKRVTIKLETNEKIYLI